VLEFLRLRRPRAVEIEEDLPATEGRYVVVDTELTGLDEKRDSIVSIGAVRMEGGRIVFADAFSRLVNPEAAFKPESVVIHGITPSDVAGWPAIEEALSDFLDFCGDDIIVGHLVFLDLMFINREMKKILGATLQNPVIDTFSLFHWLKRKTMQNEYSLTGLFDIARHMGIPVRGAHDAVMDAFTTAQVFQRLLPMLREEGVRTLGDLVRVGDPCKGGDRFRVPQEINNF
jgi:DNA polymerase-3 subunit epsilon